MNKGIKYLIVTLTAVGMTLSAHAANISVVWGAQDFTIYALANGNPLPAGDLLMVGFFSTLSGISAGNTASANLANFTEFARQPSQNGFGSPGFAGTNSVASETGFAHNQMYLVALNATSAGAATQQGIWYVELGTMPAWRFPASTDTDSSTSIDLENLTSDNGGAPNSLLAGAHIVLGTGTTSDANGNFRLIGVVPVPEPSSLMLVGVGLLGLVGLIRRRS